LSARAGRLSAARGGPLSAAGGFRAEPAVFERGTLAALRPGMNLRFFSDRELRAVLSALRAIAVANDHFTPPERAFVERIARVHGTDVDADFVDPLAFHELARRLTSRSSRKHALQLAVAMALVDGPPSDATRRSLHELALSFGAVAQPPALRRDYVAYAGALLDELQIPHAGGPDATLLLAWGAEPRGGGGEHGLETGLQGRVEHGREFRRVVAR
jgi:hypothetical protein